MIELLCILIVVVAACVLSCVGFFLTPQTTRLLCPWDYPGKNTEVICHFLLQGIFLTQESNPGSPALQADSLPSEPPGTLQLNQVYLNLKNR